MVVNAAETPAQAEVVFVIEATATNGAYINELKTNYLLPTLEYFHGGTLEEGGGNGSVYGIVTFQSADSLPSLPVATVGPLTCPKSVIEAVDKIQFIGGHGECRVCITEALVTALGCFEDFGRGDGPKHIILLCTSPPYSAYGGGLVPPGIPSTPDSIARLIGERGIQLSVTAPRRVPQFLTLYEQAGGELLTAQQRNYAKDPRHLVLLRGYSLKERPPSPAPPPAPEIQADIYSQQRAVAGRVPGVAGVSGVGGVPGVAGVTGVPGVAAGGVAPGFPRARGPWLGQRQPIYGPNSALLNQLSQPSYPPPTQPHQSQLQRMPGIMGAGSPAAPVSSAAPTMPTAGPSGTTVTAQAPQRTFIWSGVLEWMEKGKGPGDQQKVTKLLPCQVSSNSKELEPELKADTWPNKLLMQLMPKLLISNIGGQCLKDSKSVLFHLQQNEALEALTKVMINGYAGCVHFSPMPTPQCDIKVLILLYTPDKKAFLGFIPNNQATFVERLKKVIQQQKMTQMISKQLPASVGGAGAMGSNAMGGNAMGSNAMGGGNMPTANMGAGSSGMGAGGMHGGMGVGGVGMGQLSAPPLVPQQQAMVQQQGMMMGGGMGVGVGGKGARGVPQLDGLEAARAQNLEKIQQLQQTLDAAHQQEAHFRSQMDIMSNLQAAQQQEHHYKQLEEQQRKHQLQQQLQQQLRGAGGGAGGAHAPRVMRPIIPSNPGLRHLLQQQQQAARGVRPHM